MYSTHEAELDLLALPVSARRVHIVPALTSMSFLSIGQLCDSGCTVNFDAHVVHVRLHNIILLTGQRTLDTRLWHINLQLAPAPGPTPASTSSLSATSATPATLVEFAHAALFSPALSTLHIALQRGFIPNFPGLTTKTLTKYPLNSIAMVKGHMDQSRKNKNRQNPNSTPSL